MLLEHQKILILCNCKKLELICYEQITKSTEIIEVPAMKFKSFT